MKGKNNHLNEMQQLADIGWKQMQESLREHGLTNDAKVLPSSRRNHLLLLVAASLFFFIIFSYPYILNDHAFLSFNKEVPANISVEKPGSVLPPKKLLTQKSEEQKVITTEEKLKLHEKINQQFLQSKKEVFLADLQIRKSSLLKKVLIQKNCKATIPASDDKMDSVIRFEKTNSLQKKTETTTSKKIRIFAGAGMNISVEKNHSNSFLDNVNIHPGVTVIFPLNKHFSLHTGVWALSTIHGKEASAKEKELVNNISGAFYYDIKTTSIVKASYFDVPVTLNYSFNKKWSVGGGLQLSRLYKVNIREQKDSYDYNNTLFSASTLQYNSTPARAVAVFQKKVDIKKLESRLVAEANFETQRFLFSAGYYYGLGKTILVHDSYNSSQQYRNEYFKLGIQYRLNGKVN